MATIPRIYLRGNESLEDTIQEWIQEALCRCWERRHAPHVECWSSYYFTMVRGLVRTWIVRYKRHAERHIPLFKEAHYA
jgi:DNA-directed RNA polymerase specialized sigma24 family protein